MSTTPRPTLESSAALRALVRVKYARGQSTEAMILARLGGQSVKQKQVSRLPDGISRLALQQYVELMPNDLEAKQTLEALGAMPSPVSHARTFWRGALLFVMVGVMGAGFTYWSAMSAAFASVVSKPMVTPDTNLPTVDASMLKPIVIRAVGDVVLGSDYPERRLPNVRDRQRIAALHLELRHADIVVGNLEGVLSDQGKARKDTSNPNVFSFRMPTSYAATLRAMGFDVMSLANNHSMDFSAQGLASTLAALRAQGIAPMGVPSAEMAIIKVRNTRVAFLNYSYVPTFTRMNDAQRITFEIQQARSRADWVVVTVHGGKEGASASGMPKGDEYFMNEYRGNLTKFAHLVIDAGANAVFGHGPHVVRPYEMYRNKPIFYSLGNFVGYRSLSTQGKLAHSIVAEVRFSPQGELQGAGVIPLKLDRSGIPSVDYSTENVQSLSNLLLEQLEQRPVLSLAAQPPEPRK
ncbi:MAG: CapA family protein [Gallionella sp.]|nr:CapA family protein [Gallionella sp.]MDD4959792.1 CapA family protein [Gallionella sp.]